MLKKSLLWWSGGGLWSWWAYRAGGVNFRKSNFRFSDKNFAKGGENIRHILILIEGISISCNPSSRYNTIRTDTQTDQTKRDKSVFRITKSK